MDEERKLTPDEKIRIITRAFENAEWKVNCNISAEELIEAAAKDENIFLENIFLENVSRYDYYSICIYFCNKQKEYMAYRVSLTEKQIGMLEVKREMGRFDKKISDYFLDN